MKKRNLLFANLVLVFLLSLSFVSAQSNRNSDNNSDYRYENNDNFKQNGKHHRHQARKANHLRKHRQAQNNQRNATLGAAYRVANADGRISRKERKELNRLERETCNQNSRNRQGRNRRG